MSRLAATLVATILRTASACACDEWQSPPWMLRGIAAVETRSFQDPYGVWFYVDKRRGTSGERGMMQVTLDAFRIARRLIPESRYTFAQLDSPMVSIATAHAYLYYLRSHAGSWDEAIMAYNVGLRGLLVNRQRGLDYLERVKAAGSR